MSGYDAEEALKKALESDTRFHNLRQAIVEGHASVSSKTLFDSLTALYKHGYVRGALDVLHKTLGEVDGNPANGT